MAEDFAAFATKLTNLSNHLSGGNLRAIVNAVAFDAKKDAEKELERDLGGDRKFRNWKVKLGVGYKLQSESTALVSPRPSGPWSVLDGGRKPGARIPKKGKAGNRKIKTPYGIKTYSKKSPLIIGGTHGKDTWKSAMRVMRRETPERIDKAVYEAIRKALN